MTTNAHGSSAVFEIEKTTSTTTITTTTTTITTTKTTVSTTTTITTTVTTTATTTKVTTFTKTTTYAQESSNNKATVLLTGQKSSFFLPFAFHNCKLTLSDCRE